MDCETAREKHLADEYRAGRLSPEEADAYEQHYFNCDRCFEDLMFRDRLARRLKEEGRTHFAPEIAEDRIHAHGGKRIRFPRPGWWPLPLRSAWAAGLVAVAAVVAVVLLVNRTADAPDVRNLWSPTPYSYVPSELRGDTGLQEFRRGMESYLAGDYGEAARWLERSAQASPDDDVIRFYLGVSHLMSGRHEKATRALRGAVDLSPSSSLYRWYLAQAQAMSGKLEAAESELRRVIDAGGDHATEASALLEKIAEIRRNN